MPRACQRRRESTAAKKKAKLNPKPPGPPPIRHKARQKAIHNARHGRGGRPSRNQRSGNGDGSTSEQDFISFANKGNNFEVLGGTGRQNDPILLENEDDDSMEDGELITDDGSEEEDSEELYMRDAQDMMINVEVESAYATKGSSSRPEIMFPLLEAISVYKQLHQAGFPLQRIHIARFTVEEEVTFVPQETTSTPVYVGGLQIVSDTVGGSAPTRLESRIGATKGHKAERKASPNPARDYVFDFGAHKGTRFDKVPESYLRTIGGNPYLLDNHPAAKAAFDYHRPGARRTVPTDAQRAAHERTQAAAPRPSQSARSSNSKPWEDFKFPGNSAHAGKRLDEVDENYLRTIEGMAHVVKKWPGLKEALQDYNSKTGRRGRGGR